MEWLLVQQIHRVWDTVQEGQLANSLEASGDV